ncbi:MAG: chromosome segregation protein SMC, partial [Bacteroidota bacterium]
FGLFSFLQRGLKKNLEVLEVAIKKLQKDENKLSTQFYNVKTRLEELKAGIKTHEIQLEREKLSQLAQEKVSIMTRLENFENMIRDFDSNKTQSELRIQTLQRSIANNEQQLKENVLALEKAKEEISNTDGSYREVADALSVASAAFNEKNIEFIRQQNLVTTLQRELSFRENQLDETKTALERNKQTIAQNEEEMGAIKTELETLESTLLGNYDLRNEKQAALTSAEQVYFQARGGIDEIDDNIRTLNRKRNESANRVQTLKDQFTELKLEMTSISERLRLEFNITIEEVMKREP